MGDPLQDKLETKKKIQPTKPRDNDEKNQKDRSLQPKFTKPGFSYIQYDAKKPIKPIESPHKTRTSLKLDMPTVTRFTELSQEALGQSPSKYVPARERVKLKHVKPPEISTGFDLQKFKQKKLPRDTPKPSIVLNNGTQHLPVSNQVVKSWKREETRWKKLPNHYITIISILGKRRKTPFMILFEFNNIQINLGKKPLKQAEIIDYLSDMQKKGLIKSHGTDPQSYWYLTAKTESLI